MTKQFCDQCGELISGYNSSRGAHTTIKGNIEPNRWNVEIVLQMNASRDGWILCNYCCDELIDAAYKAICADRVRRDEYLLKADEKRKK